MANRWPLISLMLALSLCACDDGAADEAPDPDMAGLDMAPSDGADMAVEAPDMAAAPDADPAMTGEPGELWRLTISIAEAAGLALGVQLEAWFDDERAVFERATLRGVDAMDRVSEVFGEVTDVAIDAEGRFVMDFGAIVVPGPYNPVGVPVPATLRIEGRVLAEDAWCGDVRGEVPLLMAELTESTFGAAPWPAAAPGSCEGEVEQPMGDIIGGDRPAEVLVPEAYDAERPWPLIVLLHGYGANGRVQAGYLRLFDRVDNDGVLLAMPDGTVDGSGQRHWQGRACCGVGGEPVDDVAYITGLVAEARMRWNIGPVFAMGHSNGGFMAHDLACLASDVFDGIVSLAGSAGAADAECPGADVAVLNVHGDADETVLYDGEAWHVGAEASAQRWVDINGCGEAMMAPALDLDTAVDGAETEVTRWADCSAPVEAWRMAGSGHVPQFDATFATEAIAWLLAAVAAE